MFGKVTIERASGLKVHGSSTFQRAGSNSHSKVMSAISRTFLPSCASFSGNFPGCMRRTSLDEATGARGSRRGVPGVPAFPADQRGSPGKAAAERRQQDEVALADEASRDRLVERDRQRGGGGVAVAVDVVVAALGRDPSPWVTASRMRRFAG